MPSIAVEKDGFIATVTISNPGKLNAIASGMWIALQQSFSRLSQDDELRCVILRGEDSDFAAGADIEEFPQVRATKEQAINYHANLIAPALHAVAQCTHPTVAAIDGICVGGGLELACACDIRIASPASRFGIPINLRGFPLAPGEMEGLLNLVGKATVLEILLEGRIFDASEAREKGLIHRIASDVYTHAQETAQRIAAGAPLAARMNKKLVRRLAPGISALTDQEIQDAFSYMSSADYREGVQSFIQKRKPSFTGK
ncbi:enoyl-CoA hydratase-related protein [Oxalobacteraceae bacterium R-40]|uniref:Enoyl-CoA hydratase-related protein n=1 Tax=Keguizhuia sedimenti TaxID=3064264 RepID=A0ABU1BLQ3_9BURK|nr:enoyl-CoA hydratase-related protein [Oxalobacteraceae bacterium R-40]